MPTPSSTRTQEAPRAYPVECAWCRQDIPDLTSEVPHSSGICPKCAKAHFPDIVEAIDRERKAG